MSLCSMDRSGESMNANELADELENTYPFVGVMEIAAIVLRQQQAEIEALKEELDKWENPIYKSIPVIKIPQTKPLSDEEIGEISMSMMRSMNVGDIEFARAIEERHGIK